MEIHVLDILCLEIQNIKHLQLFILQFIYMLSKYYSLTLDQNDKPSKYQICICVINIVELWYYHTPIARTTCQRFETIIFYLFALCFFSMTKKNLNNRGMPC